MARVYSVAQVKAVENMANSSIGCKRVFTSAVSFRLRPTAGSVYRDIYVARYGRLYNEPLPQSNCALPQEGVTR